MKNLEFLLRIIAITSFKLPVPFDFTIDVKSMKTLPPNYQPVRQAEYSLHSPKVNPLRKLDEQFFELARMQSTSQHNL